MSVDKFARRLRRLEQETRQNSTQPRLPYSAIDNGTLALTDINGNPAGYVGTQYDGTVTTTSVGGTPPVSPTMPMVTAVPGGLRIYWDGTFVDGSPARMDFSKVTIHIVTDVDDFDALDAGQIYGEISSALGGEFSPSLPEGIEHFVFLVAWSQAGKFSVESDPAFGTPVITPDLEDVLLGIELAEAAGDAAINAQSTADGAQSDVDAVALAYALTKTLVDGWVYTGEVTLDGGMLQADTVVAAAILAGEIQVRHLAAEVADFVDVRAETVSAELVKAGFVMTGEVRVGGAYWNVAEGLVFPQPDGGVIRLPVDGVTAATITAHLVAKSLNVQDNFTMSGALNRLSGVLKLSNGITAPTLAPSLSQEVPSVATLTTVYGPIYYGAVTHLSDSSTIVVVENFFGSRIRGFNKTTGVPVFLGDDPAWEANFGAAGITAIGSNYYVLGQDSARSNGWYIYKLDADFAKVSEALVAPASEISARPTLGTDGTYLLMGFGDGGTGIKIRVLTTSLALAGADRLYNAGGWPGTANLSFIGEGSFDFGTGRTVIGLENGTIYVSDFSGNRQAANTWYAAGAGNLRGLHWDGTTWRSYDFNARWSTYSTIKEATTVTASYTWYDGDGTVRETTASPSASYALPARSWPRVDVGPPPDNGVAGAGVDRANRIGIYMATGASARRLQTHLANLGSGGGWQAVRTYTTNSISAGGVLESSLTNTFIGAPAASPGQLATDAGGFVLNGDGTGDWPYLIENKIGQLVAYTPTITGFSGTKTILYSKYSVVGKRCKYTLRFKISAAGGSGNITITLPFAADASMVGFSTLIGRFGGIRTAVGTHYGNAALSGAQVVTIMSTASPSAFWTATHPVTWGTNDEYSLDVEYLMA